VLLAVQSPGHVVEFSPPAMSQTVSPHTGPDGGQSEGHVALVSVGGWQVPLPHTGVVVPPQSCMHLPTSDEAHVPSPQTACVEASGGGGSSSSPLLLSPQAHAPKSTAHTNASVDVLIAAHRT